MRLSYPLLGGLLACLTGVAGATEIEPLPATPDLSIQSAQVSYAADLDTLVFELSVAGTAGATRPTAAGQLDGAPVLAYVFPTSLRPEQVGFAAGPGLLALVATSHPDFDDTPLWDENGDGNLTDPGDGLVFHTHWVVLVPDQRVAGGLAVKMLMDADPATALPATAPGMPMYMDSPGFSVVLRGNSLRIPVPATRIRALEDFHYDAVSAYLEVNQSDPARPMLGVYQVYSVLSGDLSLPQSFAYPQAH